MTDTPAIFIDNGIQHMLRQYRHHNARNPTVEEGVHWGIALGIAISQQNPAVADSVLSALVVMNTCDEAEEQIALETQLRNASTFIDQWRQAFP